MIFEIFNGTSQQYCFIKSLCKGIQASNEKKSITYFTLYKNVFFTLINKILCLQGGDMFYNWSNSSGQFFRCVQQLKQELIMHFFYLFIFSFAVSLFCLRNYLTRNKETSHLQW